MEVIVHQASGYVSAHPPVSVPTRTWFWDPAGVDRVRVEVKCCSN